MRSTPPKSAVRALLLLLPLLGTLAWTPGCFFKPRVYRDTTPAGLPALELIEADGVAQVTMLAPNPGWVMTFEGARGSAQGPRLLFTIRRPDPALIFTQAMVRKAVRTDQPLTPDTTVWARVLDHRGERGSFGPTGVEAPASTHERVLDGPEG